MARPAIHAGEILSDELKELGISASELARSLNIPTNRITQILKGQRGITAVTALRLGRWFGTGAELWLNLQKAYELRLAEELAGEEIQNTIQPRSSINNQPLVQV
jgi:addiction module HigA family antidote